MVVWRQVNRFPKTDKKAGRQKAREVGTLSSKERNEVKDFGKEKGVRVFDDLKKLDPKLVEQALRAA